MLFFLALVLPVALARPQNFNTSSSSITTTQSPQASFLGLPAAADATLERTIDVGFSCANRRLGYYADVVNECKIFHICNPVSLPDGQQAVMQYSFFCPVDSTFDQQAMTCVKEVSIPCRNSEKFYHVNEHIGVTAELPDVRHQHFPMPTATPTIRRQQHYSSQHQQVQQQQLPQVQQPQLPQVQQPQLPQVQQPQLPQVQQPQLPHVQQPQLPQVPQLHLPQIQQQQLPQVQQQQLSTLTQTASTFGPSFPQQKHPQVFTTKPQNFAHSTFPTPSTSANVVRLG